MQRKLDAYLKVRVLFTIILGPGVSRLLSGVAKSSNIQKSTSSTGCISCGGARWRILIRFSVPGTWLSGWETVRRR